MGRISASASRRDAGWRAAILLGALLVSPALPAAAQTMVFGGSTAPDVVVNENVLDALGPPPTLPGLMRQENAAGASPSGLRPFTLHPPRAHRAAAAPKPKPATEDQAQTKTQTQEAPPVAETAIPLGKASRTAKSKSSKTAPVTADVGAATTPPKATPPRSQPTQAAAAATSAPPPATAPPPVASPAPSSPINSIVRRYPAGTGAAALAAANPPPQPPPSPSPATNPPPSASASASGSSSAAPAASAPPTPTPPAAATPTQSAAAAQSATPSAPATASAPPAPPPAPPPSSQVAALPPGGGLPALPAQVVFAPNVTDLPDQGKPTLDKVIAAMKADDQVRVQLVAYASGLSDQSSLARRVSLSRALSVRTYLVEQGVKSVRIDVRALGTRPDLPGPQDRVDIVTIDR